MLGKNPLTLNLHHKFFNDSQLIKCEISLIWQKHKSISICIYQYNIYTNCTLPTLVMRLCISILWFRCSVTITLKTPQKCIMIARFKEMAQFQQTETSMPMTGGNARDNRRVLIHQSVMEISCQLMSLALRLLIPVPISCSWIPRAATFRHCFLPTQYTNS